MRKPRNLTVREIKQAICVHENVQAGPAEYRAGSEGWRATVRCPTCSLGYIYEAPDSGPRVPVGPETGQRAVTPTV